MLAGKGVFQHHTNLGDQRGCAVSVLSGGAGKLGPEIDAQRGGEPLRHGGLLDGRAMLAEFLHQLLGFKLIQPEAGNPAGNILLAGRQHFG